MEIGPASRPCWWLLIGVILGIASLTGRAAEPPPPPIFSEARMISGRMVRISFQGEPGTLAFTVLIEKSPYSPKVKFSDIHVRCFDSGGYDHSQRIRAPVQPYYNEKNGVAMATYRIGSAARDGKFGNRIKFVSITSGPETQSFTVPENLPGL